MGRRNRDLTPSPNSTDSLFLLTSLASFNQKIYHSDFNSDFNALNP